MGYMGTHHRGNKQRLDNLKNRRENYDALKKMYRNTKSGKVMETREFKQYNEKEFEEMRASVAEDIKRENRMTLLKIGIAILVVGIIAYFVFPPFMEALSESWQ